MSVDIDILKNVNNYLLKKAIENDRDYSHFHPSSWDECHRKTAYQYYESQGLIQIDKTALKINPQIERIYDNGHYLHYRWCDYLRRSLQQALFGRWKCCNHVAHKDPKIFGSDDKLGCLQPEKCECGSTRFDYVEVGFFDEETLLGGHVDAILDITKCEYYILGTYKDLQSVPSQERFFVVDFKSINPFDFKKLSDPVPKHITQMQMYLYLSGLTYGKFIYENKSDQNIKEFLVKRDEDFIRIKKEEAILLKHQITHTNSKGQHVLPPRGYSSRGHKVCLQCKYRGHCWGN